MRARRGPIGVSAVRPPRRQGSVLHVAGADVLDGTPRLDIEPYVPEFDAHPASNAGWIEAVHQGREVADGRLHGGPADSERKRR